MVQHSLRGLAPQAEAMVGSFYQRLFELDPSLRGLFHGDMRDQIRKFIEMLNVVTDQLSQLARLAPALREMGIRHAGYGVRTAHYATVRAALLGALAHSAGPTWTAELEGAWSRAYDFLARTMIEATAA
jgi:nitric oxide dioxygenase